MRKRGQPAKGSIEHFSRSTPTTSACAASRIGFLLRRRAMECAFPGSGVWMMSTSNPAA
jgi:hypothetical protein